MGYHRIVCTNQEPAGQAPTHAHIVAVGIGITSTAFDRRMTSQEVMHAMDRGEVFFTKGEQSGKVAIIQKVYCHACHGPIIRTTPDAVHDNNLDSMPYCRIR